MRKPIPPVLAEKLRWERRATAAAVLAGIALIDGVGLPWFVDTGFLGHKFYGRSLQDLVAHDVRWAVAVAGTLAGPAWYRWWRSSAFAGGAPIGTAISVASSVSVTLCVLTTDAPPYWWGEWLPSTCLLLIASGLVCAAAFQLAPPPRDPEAVSDLRVKAIVRRCRREAGTTPVGGPARPIPRRRRVRRGVVDPAYVARGPRPWERAARRARDARDARTWWAAALVGVGVVFGLVPLWLLRTPVGLSPGGRPDWDLLRAADADATWGLAAFATTFAPLWFGVWRTTSVPHGGLAGAALASGGALAAALAASGGRIRLYGFESPNYDGIALFLATATALAAAFVIAPEPDGAGPDRDGGSSPAFGADARLRSDELAARRCWSFLVAGAGAVALVALASSDLHVAAVTTCGCGRTENLALAELIRPAPRLSHVHASLAPWAWATATLALAPVVLAVWQWRGLALGRLYGVLISLSAAACVWLTVAPRTERHPTTPGTGAWLLLAIAATMAVAFAVAPAPRDRSLPDDGETRRLLRRHRAQAMPR